MPFTKLRMLLHEGKIYLAPEGKGLTQNGTADPRLGEVFEEGLPVTVRWPSGLKQTLPIKLRKHETGTALPGIEQSLNGTAVWIPLTDVEVLLPEDAEEPQSPATSDACRILAGVQTLARYDTESTLCALDKNVLCSGPETLAPSDEQSLKEQGWSYDREQGAWAYYTGHG